MTVMHVLRKAAAPATAAGLALTSLIAGAPAQAAPASLHFAATISLGRLGREFSYQFTEDPSGNVFYYRGSAVYEVKGNNAPVTALRVRGSVLAVAASPTDLFVDVGRTVTEYRRSNHHRVRSWTLPGQPGAPTSAGILVAGSTVWAWTDWATDESGFQYASVSRFSTASPTVHKVSSNNVYPGDMAADPTGLYYEAVSKKGAGYLAHATAGGVRRRNDTNLDAPLGLVNGDVYLLAINESSDKLFLNSFTEPNLAVNFNAQEAGKFTDIAGTDDGLLILGGGTLGLVLTNFDFGQIAGGELGIRHAVGLLPGPAPGVITTSGGRTSLVRVVLTG